MAVALGVLFALKGVGERAFCHWARRGARRHIFRMMSLSQQAVRK
jgi:hypothetical protein